MNITLFEMNKQEEIVLQIEEDEKKQDIDTYEYSTVRMIIEDNIHQIKNMSTLILNTQNDLINFTRSFYLLQITISTCLGISLWELGKNLLKGPDTSEETLSYNLNLVSCLILTTCLSISILPIHILKNSSTFNCPHEIFFKGCLFLYISILIFLFYGFIWSRNQHIKKAYAILFLAFFITSNYLVWIVSLAVDINNRRNTIVHSKNRIDNLSEEIMIYLYHTQQSR